MTVTKITSENFDQEVIQSSKPAVVDFYADWCGPCQVLSPIIDKLAGEYTDIKFGKVDVDKNQELATRYGVMSVPSVKMFKNGEIVDEFVGALPEDSIRQKLDSLKEGGSGSTE